MWNHVVSWGACPITMWAPMWFELRVNSRQRWPETSPVCSNGHTTWHTRQELWCYCACSSAEPDITETCWIYKNQHVYDINACKPQLCLFLTAWRAVLLLSHFVVFVRLVFHLTLRETDRGDHTEMSRIPSETTRLCVVSSSSVVGNLLGLLLLLGFIVVSLRSNFKTQNKFCGKMVQVRKGRSPSLCVRETEVVELPSQFLTVTFPLLNQGRTGYLILQFDRVYTSLFRLSSRANFHFCIVHQSFLLIERFRMLHSWLQDVRQKHLSGVLTHYLRTSGKEAWSLNIPAREGETTGRDGREYFLCFRKEKNNDGVS